MQRQFAELDNIPALIGEVDDVTAMLMQIAENIHREDLSLEDECQAIKKLHTMLGNLDKVAAIVKKSKAWCSKRYAITQDQLHYMAKQLIEDGISEDLELLKAFSDLCSYRSWNELNEINKLIREGKLDRNGLRGALKEAKAQRKAAAATE